MPSDLTPLLLIGGWIVLSAAIAIPFAVSARAIRLHRRRHGRAS